MLRALERAEERRLVNAYMVSEPYGQPPRGRHQARWPVTDWAASTRLQICIIISPPTAELHSNCAMHLFSPGETLSVAENRLEHGTNLYYAESRGRETSSAPSAAWGATAPARGLERAAGFAAPTWYSDAGAGLQSSSPWRRSGTTAVGTRHQSSPEADQDGRCISGGNP